MLPYIEVENVVFLLIVVIFVNFDLFVFMQCSYLHRVTLGYGLNGDTSFNPFNH